MFRVYKSNRPERLVDALSDLLAREPRPPFEPEWICVQSRGMDVWLAMQLAQRLGVHANTESHFPRSLIEKLLARGLGLDKDAQPAFTQERLSFAIMGALPRLLDQPALAELRAYLDKDPRGVRLPQLARRIAAVFDRYAVFRAELLEDFESNQNAEGWQPVLFRALPEALRGARIPILAGRLATALSGSDFEASRLPSRVCLFGVSSLPPLFTEILAGLSERIEVHLFVTSPSEHFWADTEYGRRGRPRPEPEDVPDARRREVGHPLLSSFGKLSQDFQDVLEGTISYSEPTDTLFVDPGTHSLLATMQSDILALRHRRSSNPEAPILPISPSDLSIVIHDCHGPVREVEVLRDQLIHALERDPTFAPEDIIVLTPDLETYGPLVEAIFGATRAGEPELPFRLAERPIRHASAVNEAFLGLLRLARTRCTSVELLDFLSLEPVRRRFGLEASELDQVATWVRESGVRFARDEDHRAQLGQPPERKNTWAFGLDRLLLGYAFTGEGGRLFSGVLPYDEIEGSSAQRLGRFAEFCHRVFGALDLLSEPRTISDWTATLSELLGALIDDGDDHAAPHQELRRALLDLGKLATESDLDGLFSIDAMESLLLPSISEAIATRGFLAGGVTFSELLPLRGIPFRVLALLGMNDSSFPRRPTPVSFDLVATEPRRGDRSVRDEDLQLFLETLLAAREQLLITYSGQAASGPARFPPSVVVGALLDSIAEGFLPAGHEAATPVEARRAVEARLVTKHPLQAHSPRYFQGGDEVRRLWSYDERRAKDAAALLGPRHAPLAFLGHALPADAEPALSVSAVELDELTRFFTHPTRSFAQDRLGLQLELDERLLEEREALDLGPLESHQLIARSVESVVQGQTEATLTASLRAEGLLPHGTAGELLLSDLLTHSIRPLANAVRSHSAGPSSEPQLIEIGLAELRLEGELGLTKHGGLFHFTPSKLRAKYRLAAWIQHLALVAAQKTEARTGVVVGRPEKGDGATILHFRPPSNAGELLEQLVRLYLQAQRAPLPLFPNASFAYAAKLSKSPPDQDAARRAAELAWAGSDYGRSWSRGERDDTYVARVFGSADLFSIAPLADAAPELASLTFEAIASMVFLPMIEHSEEERA